MMQVIDCEQGTDEWYRARLGIPTASKFAAVLAKGEGKVRMEYMRKLAGEIITGEMMDSFSNGHMDRGKVMEDEARDLYSFLRDAEPERVGFVVNGKKGCSPDSFLGPNGILEIKTALPHLLIEKIDGDRFPAQHKAQCQGALWVCERDWIEIAVYWPKLPLFVKRANRDEKYIKTLSDEVDRFNDELAETVERIRRYSATPPDLKKALQDSLNIISAG